MSIEPPLAVFHHRNYSTPSEMYSVRRKRIRPSTEGTSGSCITFTGSKEDKPQEKKPRESTNVVDFSDPSTIRDVLENLTSGEYGSVTKEIKEVMAWKMKMLNPYFVKYPELAKKYEHEFGMGKPATQRAPEGVIDLDDDGNVPNDAPSLAMQPATNLQLFPVLRPSPVLQPALGVGSAPVVILDSDDDDTGDRTINYAFQEIFLPVTALAPEHEPLNVHKPGHITTGIKAMKNTESATRKKERVPEVEVIKDKGVYVGVEDDDEDEVEDDGLGDIWKDMSMALEFSKDVCEDPAPDDIEEKDEKDCEHSFVLKDDLGYVCRVCGVIERGIETIIEIQTLKRQKTTRTYASELGNGKDRDFADVGIRLDQDLIATDVCAHPRHAKQMKPHQVEGFNFLRRNLLADNPGGCILAHAPGSGKTFMIISFMQAFLAKHPRANPLVVLPKGIISTWKKEFQRWQVEDIPLLDFYSVKADNRSQQLVVLKQWVEQKTILFLGYKQFTLIVGNNNKGRTQASDACQELLLKAPSILILDEGHTPRNEDTNQMQAIAQVQTPRKVVLSGTLYQNNVKEVFNIFNLVRPKFLKLDTSRAVMKRIMSRVHISGMRKNLQAGAHAVFFELVEHTLQKDEDFRRKVTVIQDLREMTREILHYYKGDFLDELPGLVDFTVVFNLSPKQRKEVQKLKQLDGKFKVCSVGSAIYLHPLLSSLSNSHLSSESLSAADHKVDELLEKLDVRDGIKAKFFLNMLNLCESAGEKLLVFSQFLLPLKFLEKLTIKTKGWCTGREIFMITGESSAEQRENAMDRFNNSTDARVFFGSIKACGEGISLVGASRIIILDVHLNPSVTRQAIGRAFRPGQKKKVYAYRLIGADTPEEEDHTTCFKKELIAKMWFEWHEYCGYQDVQVETVNIEECSDMFLESPKLKEDVKALYKR